MKISTATSVFVNYQIQDAVDAILQAGFEGIDLWCGRPHIFRKDHSNEALEGLRRKFVEHNVSPVSLMPAFFRYPFSLSSPIDAIRRDSVEYMKDCIHNAVVIGAKTVLVVPNHSLHGQAIDDSRSRFLDSLGEVCHTAERNGIRLGIEVVYPQLSDYMSSTEDALGVIRALGSDCLGIVLDTGHLNLSGEDLQTALRKSGNLLLQVHVNDNDGKQQQNAIPGDGAFDFAGFIHLLREFHYAGYLTLELGRHYSFDPIPAVVEALGRVRWYLSPPGDE